MKALFIVLALLVAAFVLVIGRRSPASLAGVAETPRWLKWIDDRSKPAFDFRAIPPGCFQHGSNTFMIASTCVTRINPGRAQDRFRLLRLTVKTGRSAVVEFTPAADDDSGLPRARRTLVKGGKTESFTIPAQGGSLVIACLPPGPCAVGAE